MRWEVVGLVLGWTIGLVAIPLGIVTLYSAYVEGCGRLGEDLCNPPYLS